MSSRPGSSNLASMKERLLHDIPISPGPYQRASMIEEAEERVRRLEEKLERHREIAADYTRRGATSDAALAHVADLERSLAAERAELERLRHENG